MTTSGVLDQHHHDHSGGQHPPECYRIGHLIEQAHRRALSEYEDMLEGLIFTAGIERPDLGERLLHLQWGVPDELAKGLMGRVQLYIREGAQAPTRETLKEEVEWVSRWAETWIDWETVDGIDRGDLAEEDYPAWPHLINPYDTNLSN